MTPALILTAGVLLTQAPPPHPPVYHVHRTAEAIRIDGRLDDRTWLGPPTARLVRNEDGAPGEPETEARLAWDDSFLYVAFRSRDDNVWATFTERDAHLWTEEVVEVFIQPDPTRPVYLEIEVNPLGALLDIFLIDVRKPIPYSSWDSRKIQWAVTIDGKVDGIDGDRGWTCEIAIPMEEMVTAPRLPPQEGDRWRLNLYRVERRPRKAGLALSPTLRSDFHVPARFATIVFARENPPRQ